MGQGNTKTGYLFIACPLSSIEWTERIYKVSLLSVPLHTLTFRPVRVFRSCPQLDDSTQAIGQTLRNGRAALSRKPKSTLLSLLKGIIKLNDTLKLIMMNLTLFTCVK